MVYQDYHAGSNQNDFGQNSIYSCDSYVSANHWRQIAESAMPLKQSKMASLNNKDYTQLNNGYSDANNNNNFRDFQYSLDLRAESISRKLIVVNAISLFINLLLAMLAFYFSFVNNSSATSAFATDCVLDFISSAIVLWRYCGDDLSSVYRHAREQIACIYLGALFEISAVAIIVKASTDMAGAESTVIGDEPIEDNYDLIYLALAASIACTVLTVFKCSLYKTIRDNSILLDVINTLVSTVFAMSIIMSQALINVNPTFWYMDPVLSIFLALFMAAFGIKVIHQNFNILRPVYRSTSSSSLLRSFSSNQLGPNGPGLSNKNSQFVYENQTGAQNPRHPMEQQVEFHNAQQFGINLNASIEQSRHQAAAAAAVASLRAPTQNDWQKSDHSSISFV